jgi:2'-5' RNA ligase
MPHITVIYPFRLKKEFDALVEEFTRLCEQIIPFTIEFTRFRFFEHQRESYTLWLAPEPDEPLIRLQKKLLQTIPDCNDVNLFPGGYTPHLSVGQVRGRPRLRTLQEKLQRSWKSLFFVVHEVSLIWRAEPPNDIFRVFHKVKLNG